MNPPPKTSQRVKVDEAQYNEEGDTVSWTVTILDGPLAQKKADLVWRRADFGPTFRINALVPIPLVKEFCLNMVGKELTVMCDQAPPSQQVDMGQVTEKMKEWLQDQ